MFFLLPIERGWLLALARKPGEPPPAKRPGSIGGTRVHDPQHGTHLLRTLPQPPFPWAWTVPGPGTVPGVQNVAMTRPDGTGVLRLWPGKPDATEGRQNACCEHRRENTLLYYAFLLSSLAT